MRIEEEVQVKVVEVLNDGSLIMSFNGQLYRVQNHSNKKYRLNDWVKLKVKKIQPLEFKILD